MIETLSPVLPDAVDAAAPYAGRAPARIACLRVAPNMLSGRV